MALKVNFEIGHEASIKTRRTHEMFTHDWEVFVRGVDNADISQFVDKVVFHLHDTFSRPKRVVKEPPYVVKESGYAGFNLPIEIHLKNRDEPKKIKFNYDLHLQPAGPAIIKVRKEKYIFQNPNDDFKRKLLKGGAVVVTNQMYMQHPNIDHERNNRDAFVDEKQNQLIGKPKLSDPMKKHKVKEYEPPRCNNAFTDLFGTPIHKTSTISPEPKKTVLSPKIEKKEKDKSYSEREKQKNKYDSKEKEYKEDKKLFKEEKIKVKDDHKSKTHRERDSSKEKSSKRPLEKPLSPSPPAKRQALYPSHSPRRVPSPCNKSNSSASSKEEVKSIKPSEPIEVKNKVVKTPEKSEKKAKREKKSHDKDRENKKEHKKEKEIKLNIQENKKDMSIKDNSTAKDKPGVKPDKPINKFSIENMLKEPNDTSKYTENLKYKNKADHERKHKHKKKDKKHDMNREKNKESSSKDKKHKHEKHKEIKESSNGEKLEPNFNNDKINAMVRNIKDSKESFRTMSPISLDTSSQSSSNKTSKHKNPLGSMIDALSNSSSNDSDNSIASENEDSSFNTENTKSMKILNKTSVNSLRNEPVKLPINDVVKNDKPSFDRINQNSNHKSQKNKEKSAKQENKEEKKQRKRKSNSKSDDSEVLKMSKSDGMERASKVKRADISNNLHDNSQRAQPDSKVQDDGVSSSLSDNPPKCESPVNEEDSRTAHPNEISPDYMIQLQELQQRIMTIQSNDELERVVNLIAETGKYEVTKKTFDFDLCLLDRTTVQQLQELIGCESRA